MAKQIFWSVGEGRLLASTRAALFTREEGKLQAKGTFLGQPYRGRAVPYGAVVPPAFSEGQISAFRTATPNLTRPFIFFLGRLQPKSGCDILLRVARIYPEHDFVFVGPDELNWRASCGNWSSA